MEAWGYTCDQQQRVERVLEYKYLGTALDHKLTFDSNNRASQKKCQSIEYIFHKNYLSLELMSRFYRKVLQDFF